MLYALQFAKIVSVLASRTPPSGLPTKKLLLRYFASLRISLSTLLLEKSNAPFFRQCSRQGYSFRAYFTALTSSGSFSGSSSFSSMSWKHRDGFLFHFIRYIKPQLILIFLYHLSIAEKHCCLLLQSFLLSATLPGHPKDDLLKHLLCQDRQRHPTKAR